MSWSQEHRNAVQAALLNNISAWMPNFPDPQECIDYYGPLAFPDSVRHELSDRGKVPEGGLSFGAALDMQQTAIAITVNKLVETIERHS